MDTLAAPSGRTGPPLGCPIGILRGMQLKWSGFQLLTCSRSAKTTAKIFSLSSRTHHSFPRRVDSCCGMGPSPALGRIQRMIYGVFARSLQESWGLLALLHILRTIAINNLVILQVLTETDPVSGHHSFQSLTSEVDGCAGKHRRDVRRGRSLGTRCEPRRGVNPNLKTTRKVRAGRRLQQRKAPPLVLRQRVQLNLRPYPPGDVGTHVSIRTAL